jgi:hypothetical protein
MARSLSSMKMFSVISSTSAVGSMRVTSSTRATLAQKPGSISWRADTFTARSSGAPGCSASHRPRSRQLRSRTHAPIPLMSPVCSATITIDVLETAPRSGWSHRKSASTPVTSPSALRTIG